MTYFIDLIAVDLTDVVRLRAGLLDHFESDWGKDAVLSSLPAKFATHGALTTMRIRVAAEFVAEAGCSAEARPNVGTWVEEPCILIRKLHDMRSDY